MSFYQGDILELRDLCCILRFGLHVYVTAVDTGLEIDVWFWIQVWHSSSSQGTQFSSHTLEQTTNLSALCH